MRVCLGFLSIIRFWLLIQAVRVLAIVSASAANWLGERSGLNDALISCLDLSDGQEVSAEPSTALYANSHRGH
jgi:hypothetical protein